MAAITLSLPRQLPVGFRVQPVPGDCSQLSVSAETAGGRPPYFYEWSTGEQQQTITASPGEVLSVLITDHHGRHGLNTITVPEPECECTDQTTVQY